MNYVNYVSMVEDVCQTKQTDSVFVQRAFKAAVPLYVIAGANLAAHLAATSQRGIQLLEPVVETTGLVVRSTQSLESCQNAIWARVLVGKVAEHVCDESTRREMRRAERACNVLDRKLMRYDIFYASLGSC